MTLPVKKFNVVYALKSLSWESHVSSDPQTVIVFAESEAQARKLAIAEMQDGWVCPHSTYPALIGMTELPLTHRDVIDHSLQVRMNLTYAQLMGE